jgi:hypothetical protein
MASLASNRNRPTSAVWFDPRQEAIKVSGASPQAFIKVVSAGLALS